MTQQISQRRPKQRKLRIDPHAFLTMIGVLWLILAAAIVISEFRTPASVTITWNTETELGTAGFHILRSESPDGVFEQITPTLISGLGNEFSGAAYEYVDDKVDPGKDYFYKLQEIEVSGNVPEPYYIGPGTSPRFEWWAIVLALISLLTGTALIATGLRGILIKNKRKR